MTQSPCAVPISFGLYKKNNNCTAGSKRNGLPEIQQEDRWDQHEIHIKVQQNSKPLRNFPASLGSLRKNLIT
ncbi:hypothetical protein MTR_7g056253 [Medicago truncatula]|uniref:Uncharacterized protein n=1 Tax=Medicago truncatula TaxID=3880 RepID=A0A072TZL9_MEDTR|nr:hypothetical protein MTR_7g056253 [Medicago truncatula]